MLNCDVDNKNVFQIWLFIFNRDKNLLLKEIGNCFGSGNFWKKMKEVSNQNHRKT